MKKLFVLLFIFLTAGVFAQQNVSAPQKYALVIGNGNYTGSWNSLSNPVNDAVDMEAALRGLGFQVELLRNANLNQMQTAVLNFARRLSSSRNAYGFFYYAGHGAQDRNKQNYLIPADADTPSVNLFAQRTLPVQFVLDELRDAGNELNMVVLDACRNLPKALDRSDSRGLSVISAVPRGTIVMYATAADSTAADGTGRNGLFTSHLLRNLKTPGLDVNEMFRRTGSDVARATNGEQYPETRYMYFETAYLGARPSGGRTEPNPNPTPVAQPIPEGLEFEIVEGRSVTITKYTGNATTLNIPAQIQSLPVTVIGNYAFPEHSSLTSITIPSSVISIGEGAFVYCDNLISITIPSSVISIGNYAFSGISSLTNITVDSRNPAYTSIDGILFDKNIRTIIAYPAGKTARTYTIPSSATSIGDEAFTRCRNLTSVTIPSSVTTIGIRAFHSCTNLTSITIPSSVTTIGGGAFARCYNLTSIAIPSSVTTIGGGAFADCSSLTSITIPSSVTSIEGNMFSRCSNLTSVTIPSSVTTIAGAAFSDCRSLTNVTIPSSVTTIGGAAFVDCSSLTSVTLSRRTQVGERAFPETARIIYRD